MSFSAAILRGAGSVLDLFSVGYPDELDLGQRVAPLFNASEEHRLASDWEQVGRYFFNALAHDLVKNRDRLPASSVKELSDSLGQLFLFQLGEYDLEVRGFRDAQ